MKRKVKKQRVEFFPKLRPELEDQLTGTFGSPAKKTLWLYFFTDKDSLLTFFNPTESAISAGFDAKGKLEYRQIGERLKIEFDSELREYLKKCHLSDVSVMGKLVELMNAKKKKIFSHNGLITDQVEMPDTDVQIKVLKLILDHVSDIDPSKSSPFQVKLDYIAPTDNTEPPAELDIVEQSKWFDMEIERKAGILKELEDKKKRLKESANIQ